MIHFNTTNDSAVKMAYLLGEMGVKNNKFMLRLDNPALLHVDPFSETLTELEKAMITHEIINNPWYFFREIVRIPAGGGVARFEFHRGTLALVWAVINDISAFVVWPRQAYKTTTMCTIYNYLYYWGSVHNKMVFIAHEDAIVKKNLQGVKDIRDNLPDWLNQYDSKKDRDNEREMYNRSNDNRISCRAPARNPDGARKAGRGLTTPSQWFDEIAFISYIGEMYDSISFAYSKASELARENGSPYHQIMTTTAGFLNTEEGKWSYKFLMSCADFSESYYDMEIEVVKTIINNTSTSGFIDLSFMYYDLGKDENYLDDQKRRLANSPTPQDTLDREVLNKWKDISTEHPLGQERIERLNTLIKSPLDHAIINDTYAMRIYVDLSKFDCSKQLIGGMDLGGNLKGDFSTLVVIDPTNFKVVAVMRTNSQSTTLYSMGIISIMTDLFPNLVIFPERNYNGAIIDNIVSYIPGGTRRVYHEGPDRPGIFNSKKIRPILFNVLLRIAVDEYGDRIMDKTIISEISGLIRLRNGRIDHRPGNHDDTLMAYLLGLYFLLYVEDVGMYIDKSKILSDFDKGNMVGVIGNSGNAKKKTDSKLRRIIGDQYNDLMSHQNEIHSIEDLSNLLTSKKIFRDGMKTKIHKVSGEFDGDSLEDSDDLDNIRSNIANVKDNENSVVKPMYVENRGVNRTNDFKSVFNNWDRIFGNVA